ncbi:hypothetical protein RJ639_005477 [Escallonia herrerae]|uniref:DUF4220 domain-containing protein n=1 Tax=Escallonia herrerae TaxID=1293975 RepID=A0AA88VU55_9ASTE|nr:hypothetical protein RJ639_005477 [Escallonia herrerae]
MAVWVAVVALGKLSDFVSQGDSSSRSNKDGPNSALMALWAPLLLLHLGCPDTTITAFSVEDIPTCGPRFPAKYDIFARLDQIKNEEHNLKLLVTSVYLLQTLALCETEKNGEPFMTVAWTKLTEVLMGSSVESIEIFRMIDIQLGLMYDMFYTKASSIYCTAGCLLRSISFICMVTVLVAFSMIRKGAGYSEVDIDITYLLLVGAVLLEIYGITLMISSEWMILWLAGHRENPLVMRILLVLTSPTVYNLKGRRWSGVVAQLDYLSEIDDAQTMLTSKRVHFDAKNPRQVTVEMGGRKNTVAEFFAGNTYNRWEILSELWEELLCNAAAQCPLDQHYESLRLGGEFLTHVWLLLVIHGLTNLNIKAGGLLRQFARKNRIWS